MTITICGGGSLGHVCIGVLAQQSDVSINLLTTKPEDWSSEIIITDNEGKRYFATINKCSNDASAVIPEADIVLLCLPGFLIEQTLTTIRPHLHQATVVGSIVCSTGFFFCAHRILGEETRLFGFQRVPFIARVAEYGRSARLLGYKGNVNIATENIDDRESFRALIENLFITPTSLLGSHYEASLTNSNPILHTGRLYDLWGHWDGQPTERIILFYKEWTIEAAQLLIEMDKEFMSLLEVLPMNSKAIPTLLDYYESHDAQSLCNKLQSIKAFESITAPMKDTEEGWVPDFHSRYFTEDFPYGLKIIHDLAQEHSIITPTINCVYEWGMSVLENN